MPQSGFTPIITYNTATASAAPSAGNLTQGELAVNVTDKKIYTKNSGGSVVQVGSGPDATETLTNKTLTNPDINGGTVDGTPIGSTTPSTGAFTTLSASDTVTQTTNANAQKWLQVRNTNAGSSASGGVLLGNDANAAYGAVVINSSTNTSLGGVNSVNFGSYGAVTTTLIAGGVVRLSADGTTGAVAIQGSLAIGTPSTTYKTEIYGAGSTGLSITASDNSNAYLRFNSNGVLKAVIGYSTALGGIGISHSETGSTLPGSALVVKEGAVNATGTLAMTGPSSTIGYGTGSGGTVTQATSKSTGVTLNKGSGQITMNNAALAAGVTVSFVLTNSLITSQDCVDINLKDGSFSTVGTYQIDTHGTGPGYVWITVKNLSAGSLSEAIVINFQLNKGATA